MGFADILGQMVQQGVGGQSQTRARDRLSRGANSLDQQGGGLGDIFGQLQKQFGGTAGSGATGGDGGVGGLAEMARDFLGKPQVGGMTTGQIGGIGAAAGALLGGGLGGAARGGIMAVLGTMALSALKGAGAQAQTGGASGQVKELHIEPKQVDDLTSQDTQKLLLKAMISAAKADGSIDQAEMEKIIGKISGDSVTADEKQFVMNEMRAPLDVDALAAEVNSPMQAAEVYAASILAIEIDSDQERQYLARLAQALRMEPDTVAKLHEMTGAPRV